MINTLAILPSDNLKFIIGAVIIAVALVIAAVFGSFFKNLASSKIFWCSCKIHEPYRYVAA